MPNTLTCQKQPPPPLLLLPPPRDPTSLSHKERSCRHWNKKNNFCLSLLTLMALGKWVWSPSGFLSVESMDFLVHAVRPLAHILACHFRSRGGLGKLLVYYWFLDIWRMRLCYRSWGTRTNQVRFSCYDNASAQPIRLPIGYLC
jgi:hypothetical protein